MQHVRMAKEQKHMSDENNQVVGEETLSTVTMEVKEIPLVQPGKYTATFKGHSIRRGKDWNSVPNISLQHKLGEDGNNRVVFSTLLLGLNPDKNGQLNYTRKNGLKAFLATIGTDIEKLRIITQEVTNPESGETVKLKFLDAQQIAECLEQYKGAQYRVRVTIQKGTQGYSDKNDVFEFLPLDS